MKTVRPEVTGRAAAATLESTIERGGRPRDGPSSIDPEELIAATSAANLLHVRPATLTCWRYEKRGPPFVKVGRFVFYRKTDLSEWLAAQRHEPQAA
jgi:hypothetical protein